MTRRLLFKCTRGADQGWREALSVAAARSTAPPRTPDGAVSDKSPQAERSNPERNIGSLLEPTLCQCPSPAVSASRTFSAASGSPRLAVLPLPLSLGTALNRPTQQHRSIFRGGGGQMGEAGYGSRVALSAGQTISSAPLRAPTSNAQCTNLPCSSRPPPAASRPGFLKRT